MSNKSITLSKFYRCRKNEFNEFIAASCYGEQMKFIFTFILYWIYSAKYIEKNYYFLNSFIESSTITLRFDKIVLL